MTQLVQLDERAKAIERLFVVNSKAMANMIPRSLGDPTRLIRIAYNSVAYDPLLLETSKTAQGMGSIMGGVMEALKLGLTIGGPAQESWLVPFRQKGVLEAVLIIGFQGYRNLLDRAKSVIDLHPRTVYENDDFSVDFGTSKIRHRPYWLLGKAEAGAMVAVYAIAHLQRGGVQVEVMPKREVDEHRARSRAKDSGPWVSDYDAMALKTVIRKIAKYLPKSSDILMRALDLDDRADRGVPQNFDMTGIIIDDLVPESGLRQVGSRALEKLKDTLGCLPVTTQADLDRVRAEAEGAPARIVAGKGLVPGAASEEAKRELDEVLGGGILELAMGPPSAGQQIAEDNRQLDAEIAAKDRGGQPTSVGDQARDLLAGLAKTADEKQKGREGRR